MERTPSKSAHKGERGRRQFSCRSCRDSNPQPSDHESGALPTSCLGLTLRGQTQLKRLSLNHHFSTQTRVDVESNLPGPVFSARQRERYTDRLSLSESSTLPQGYANLRTDSPHSFVIWLHRPRTGGLGWANVTSQPGSDTLYLVTCN